jgi:uncharacterized protein (TIGR03083 family)
VALAAAEIERRVADERGRLLAVLEGLDDAQWRTPSLCAGWSVRDLVVHLLMPYELSVPRFLALLARARGNFDRLADRWAREDRRTPEQALAGLRATAARTFSGGSGAPPDAPLTHLVIHAEDVYRPLGVPSPTDPADAVVALQQLSSPRFQGLAPGLQDALSFAATDADWRCGSGPEVTGPATALMSTLAGRTAAFGELSGDGVPTVRERLAARS